jgi:hypothetical protein
MSLVLDPATEARIQQEFATGRYAAPAARDIAALMSPRLEG